MTTDIVPRNNSAAPAVPLRDVVAKMSRRQLEDVACFMGEQIRVMAGRMCLVNFEGQSQGFLELRQIGSHVCKIYVEVRIPTVQLDIKNWEIHRGQPQVGFDVSVATEGDLIDFEKLDHLTGDQLVAVRRWLSAYREGGSAPAPLRVEITNAEQLAPRAKVAQVTRDPDGKISGLVVESIPDPAE